MEDIDVFKIDEANEKAGKRYERRHVRDIDDLKKVLKLPEGRRMVWKILSETGVFRASFSLNSMQTAFHEGKRDVGLKLIMAMDEAEPMAYAQMLREHYSEAKSKKKED